MCYWYFQWVIPLKDNKSIAIANAFRKMLKEFNRKPNKVCVDKGSEFYNRSMKSFLENNNTEMYSMHNRGKSVVAERFIRISNNKTHDVITSISKNISIDKLDDIVHKYNITYHRTIKMKPVDVKSNTCINSSWEIKKLIIKILNFKLVILLEYQNILTISPTSYVPETGLKKFLWFKYLKTLCDEYMLLVILTEKGLLERFTKKSYKNQIKKSLELKK